MLHPWFRGIHIYLHCFSMDLLLATNSLTVSD